MDFLTNLDSETLKAELLAFLELGDDEFDISSMGEFEEQFVEFIGGYKKMKNGIHRNRKQLEELSVNRILGELYDKAKAENDGKVHIREIEDGHVGDTIELY